MVSRSPAYRPIAELSFQNTENMNFFVDNSIVVKRHRLIPGSGVNLDYFKVLEYPPEDTIEFVFISRIITD